jgi:hypothetical protein
VAHSRPPERKCASVRIMLVLLIIAHMQWGGEALASHLKAALLPQSSPEFDKRFLLGNLIVHYLYAASLPLESPMPQGLQHSNVYKRNQWLFPILHSCWTLVTLFEKVLCNLVVGEEMGKNLVQCSSDTDSI